MGDFFMKEKLVKMQDESYKNMQNPDFLWEVPKDGTERHFVREMQEVKGSRVDTDDNRGDENSSGSKP